MVSRKRAREEAEEDSSARVVAKRTEPLPLSLQDQEEHGLLHELRNMWEFSNLMQYIYSFGKVVKISDDIDIDVRDPPLFLLLSLDIYSCALWFSFMELSSVSPIVI